MARSQYGFFPASGTDYAYGSEPELARRLTQLGRALKLHLIGISGHRTPQHSVEVGGFANDPHTRGQASDTPGIEGVPETTLRQYGLTRPFPGTAELDHIQLLGGARGSSRATRQPKTYTLADYWTQAGGRRALAPIMAAIAMAESGGDETSVGGPNNDGSYDYGLWQINSSHTQFDHAKLISDPLYNARAAVSIERSQGLGAWTTYKSGAYQGFMGSGRSAVPTFGRTRPGGETTGGGGGDAGGDGVDAVFASYVDETSAQNALWNIPGTPLVLPFDPRHVFRDATKAVHDATSFFQWIAILFHPRNILRVVEFLAGFTLILVGIHTSLETYRGGGDPVGNAVGRGAKRATRTAVQATPVGRGMRVARGTRAGKAQARNKSRRAEYDKARKQAQTGEGRKRKSKSNERAMNEKYGETLPF